MKQNLMTSLFLVVLMSGSAFAADAAKQKAASKVEKAKVESKDAATVSFDESAGKADFYAVGVPSMLKIHGNTSELSGKLTKDASNLSGSFKIPMKTFMTGLSLRDKHLKEKVFEVEKYPDAVFTLNPIKMAEGVTTVPFTGKLNFHGVEKPVSGDVKLTVSDSKSVQHEAKFEVKLSDFNIPTPEFAGMKIQDTVKVEVNGTATSKQ